MSYNFLFFYLAADPETFDKSLLSTCSNLIQRYEKFRQRLSKVEFGKTAQFWLNYLDVMRLQHQGHAAIQTNDFEMRSDAWERVLPYYFVFNKMNYARCGSYYIQVLKQSESKYPGLKKLLLPCRLSVQAQEAHPVRTAIDQRGEQTINRSFLSNLILRL